MNPILPLYRRARSFWRRWCSIGARGERYAARYLRRAGYFVLVRNWRSGRHELDIVAWHGSVLVFVEVKTRSAGAWVGGLASVNARKRRAIGVAARKFLRGMRPPPQSIQFDVVELWLCKEGGFHVNHQTNIPLFPQGWVIHRKLWPRIKDIHFSKD